ncbi:MAG: pyroglutamyl-peptidase I [Streptococcus sp.]|jgi:pyroglutamyl-peptidase I|uniref:pyroglutamyl-peptidase I n=1 Tax=Lactobacillales TaxID=186826 RepID=UPI0006608B84|nr:MULTISPECIES: pyroglutamyl-peptidase I [Lactobacillales]MBF1709341.1 pyroglutamyl-peptidase I [Streptococcus sp.]MBF1711156.1 pyroglutamyl-peptidase I [Streptococcus sp.]MBF1724441.1 pyroglutamyl-peptidase I [Streptococcus sp.]MDK8380659.1 pyroglutamyl-peptidase I [Granulicatella sp. UMB5615B]MDK8521911.1 pyroglutamyl-peptidase I [Granulicatella sp. UMB5615A]
MKIIVTGFDPFGGETINPSIECVKALPEIEGVELIRLELPTVFKESAKRLNEVINDVKPDAVLSVGQAGGRPGITMERIAINVDDARIPDNISQQPIDETIQTEGEAAYFTTLPIKRIVKAIREAGISAEVSNSAGTFVCNHIMYQSLFAATKADKPFKAGFMHIPFIPEQTTDKPSLPLEESTRALQIAIETIRDYLNDEDIKVQEGTIF